jgi:hypothetical protein
VFFYIEVIKCTPRHYCLRCRQVIYKDLIFLNNLLASILALLRHNRDKDVNSCVTLCVLFQFFNELCSISYFPLVQLCRFGIFQDILGKFFFRIITTLNFSKISEMKHNQGGFNNCL